MNPLIAAALIALASYRVWRFVAVDTFAPVLVPRTWLLNQVKGTRAAWLGELISCPWCAGSWITAAVTAVTAQAVSVAVPVLAGVAAAAVVGLLVGLDEDARVKLAED